MASTITAYLVMPGKFLGDRFLAHCQELHDHFKIDQATLQIEFGDPNHPGIAPKHI